MSEIINMINDSQNEIRQRLHMSAIDTENRMSNMAAKNSLGMFNHIQVRPTITQRIVSFIKTIRSKK